MPYDLTNTLVIGISSTALFDLREEDEIFKREFEADRHNAMSVYRELMLEREDRALNPGAAYPLVQALLTLNGHCEDCNNGAPLVEVVVMSRNSPETGMRILNNLRDYGLNITRTMFAGGESVVDYLEAYSVDLFLSTSTSDAQSVADSEVCAAAVLSTPPADGPLLSKEQVRIAFDGDAVLFSDESEIVYKKHGIEQFHAEESAKEDIPLGEGPFANFLKKLSNLQELLPFGTELSPVRIALVTARNSPAEIRVIKTLREWGVYVDEAFFLGGVEKTKILQAFKPHIFFDDQDVHLDAARKYVPVAKVLYKSDSPLSVTASEKVPSKKTGPRES